MKYKYGYVTTPMKVTDANLSGNGTVIRKPTKSVLWNRHDVDQQAGLIRKRYGTRSAGAYKQYGMANGYAHFVPRDFLYGVGLWAETPGFASIKSPLIDDVIGWAPITEALAYRIAALRRGVVLEVYNV